MPLTLQEAQAVIAGAHERAAKIGAPVTVAVVDDGAHLQALGRMSGAAPLSARIAETKAASVALSRRDGAALRQLQEANPGFFAQLGRAVRGPILAGAWGGPSQVPDWVWGTGGGCHGAGGRRSVVRAGMAFEVAGVLGVGVVTPLA